MFCRSLLTQRTMRANCIIFVFPAADYLPCFLEIVEPVQVKTFIPEFPIEAFNETVLHGFPGIDKHMLYMLLTGPCIEGITGKFGTVVRKNIFRPATEQHSFIQISYYMLSGNGCIYFQGNTFPRNLIEQGEYAELSASNGTITDKVH